MISHTVDPGTCHHGFTHITHTLRSVDHCYDFTHNQLSVIIMISRAHHVLLTDALIHFNPIPMSSYIICHNDFTHTLHSFNHCHDLTHIQLSVTVMFLRAYHVQLTDALIQPYPTSMSPQLFVTMT